MAERRMFAKSVVDSDAFLCLPLKTQALYFQLGVRADDDGFVSNPRKLLRMLGASDKDLRTLIESGYIIDFESGVIAIAHWRVNNYLQRDRYKETVYMAEKEQLTVNESGMYTRCIQSVYNLYTQYSLVKSSLVKSSKVENINAHAHEAEFEPPTFEEVDAYCMERGGAVDAKLWYDHYAANGWMVGNNPMKDWKASIRTWERNERSGAPKAQAHNAELSEREKKAVLKMVGGVAVDS